MPLPFWPDPPSLAAMFRMRFWATMLPSRRFLDCQMRMPLFSQFSTRLPVMVMPVESMENRPALRFSGNVLPVTVPPHPLSETKPLILWDHWCDAGTIREREERDDALLDQGHQVAYAQTGTPQVNQRVDHELARAVVGHLAAAIDLHDVDVDTEQVSEALLKLGCRPKVHYSIQEGRKRSGLKAETKPEDYLQGDPVVLSVFWKEQDGTWVERPYQYFVTEKITVNGKEIIKPWTPHFVFHASGTLHSSGTGCIACPCDCPGGIIADNRNPIYDPKPSVRFDMSKAPSPGTQVYVKIRPITSTAN